MKTKQQLKQIQDISSVLACPIAEVPTFFQGPLNYHPVADDRHLIKMGLDKTFI